MRARTTLLGVLGAVAMVPAAHAADASHIDQTASALAAANAVFYQAPQLSGIFTPAQIRQLEQLIEHRDPSRFQVAVVPIAWVDAAGGIDAFVGALDRALGLRPGVLLVISLRLATDPGGGLKIGRLAVQASTSFARKDAVVAALRRGFNEKGNVEDETFRAVRALIALDPKRAGATPERVISETHTETHSRTIIIVPAIAIPLLIAFGMFLRHRRRIAANRP